MFRPNRPDAAARRRALRRKKRKKFIPWQALLAGAVVVLLAVVAIWFFFLRPFDPGREVIKTDAAATDAWAITAEGFYYTNGSTLYAVSHKNQAKWSAATMKDAMKVAAGTNNVAVHAGSSLQCYDANGNLRYAKEFFGDILQVACGNQMIAVHVKEASGVFRFLVIGNDGVEAPQLSLEGCHLIDFGFLSNDDLYLYGVDTRATTPSSLLHVYNSELSATGKISISGQLLQHVDFSAQYIHVVGSTHLQQLTALGEKTADALIYGWTYVSGQQQSGATTYALVPGDAATQRGTIATVRLVSIGKVDVYIQMKPDVTHAVLYNGSLYCVANNTLAVYQLSGAHKVDYTLDFSPQNVSLHAASGVLVLTGQDHIYLLRLP